MQHYRLKCIETLFFCMIFLFLCKRMQQLESESCAQQREQESVLAVICKSLKEEHQVELQGLKKQMAQVQENHRT